MPGTNEAWDGELLSVVIEGVTFEHKSTFDDIESNTYLLAEAKDVPSVAIPSRFRWTIE